MTNLSVEALTEALEIKKKIERLTRRLEGMFARREIGRRMKVRRHMSAATRKAAAERMRMMWAAAKRRGQDLRGRSLKR